MNELRPERRGAIVGGGRAGGAFATALRSVGWTVDVIRARPLLRAIDGSTQATLDQAHLILLTVPDAAIGAAADSIGTVGGVVAHVSGATGLEPLAAHERVGSIHPLMSLPDPDVGAHRLLDECTFAVDGDPLMAEVVADLGGRAVVVDGAARALYHATASIAANHLVALCGQVERLAAEVAVPVDAYLRLMSTTLDNVVDVGASDALTGPAARGDWETVRSHIASLPTDRDQSTYLALCGEASDLAGSQMPADLKPSP